MHEQQLGIGRNMSRCPARRRKRSVAEIDSDQDLPEWLLHPALTEEFFEIAFLYFDRTSPTACAAAIVTCWVAYEGTKNSSAKESSALRPVSGRSRRASGREPSAIHSDPPSRVRSMFALLTGRLTRPGNSRWSVVSSDGHAATAAWRAAFSLASPSKPMVCPLIHPTFLPAASSSRSRSSSPSANILNIILSSVGNSASVVRATCERKKPHRVERRWGVGGGLSCECPSHDRSRRIIRSSESVSPGSCAEGWMSRSENRRRSAHDSAGTGKSAFRTHVSYRSEERRVGTEC